MMSPAVSVIVPIYKVERFIERCARGLLQQTLPDIEYIFVDDCSPDDSIVILQKTIQEYPDKAKDIQLIRHPVNRGLPAARNSGLEVATGEFIFHCDSDDWVEKDALAKLYKKAKEDESDIVWCDWYLSFKNNERYMSQAPYNGSILSSINCVKMILGGKLKYNVWNKLVRRNLYEGQNIRFPDGHGMGEDMTMIQLFALANKVSYLPEALYHYVRLNEEAFTIKTNDEHLKQLRYNVDRIVLFLTKYYGNQLTEHIQYFKLNVKLPFLISKESKSYKRWLEWYPEANSYINKNPMFNWRIKFIQKAALRQQFWVLKLYYVIIIRFVYGVIYQ